MLKGELGCGRCMLKFWPMPAPEIVDMYLAWKVDPLMVVDEGP